jgi:hypothetical protein
MCKSCKGAAKIVQATIGAGLAADSVIEDRRVICRACPASVKVLGGVSKCEECGCFIGPKTRLKSERCPRGKW